nr:immunoglobulin heavy chain junction region [Mus musculus]
CTSPSVVAGAMDYW